MVTKLSKTAMAVALLACVALVQAILVYPRSPEDAVSIAQVTEWKEDCGKVGTQQPCPGWTEADHLKHRDRWNRVLKALGREPGGMTAIEAQSYVNKHAWKRWVQVAPTLATLEARAAYWEAVFNIASVLATLLAAMLAIVSFRSGLR